MVGGDTDNRLVPRESDTRILHKLAGDPESSGTGALADTTLEDVQVALLNGELDIAHVPVMTLQQFKCPVQLGALLGHEPAEIGNREGRVGTRHDVLSLGIREVVAGGMVVAGCRITREHDATTRGIITVAKDHGLDGACRSDVSVDALVSPVLDCPLTHPGVEHGRDRCTQLFERVVGKSRPGVVRHDLVQVGDQV